MASGSQSHVLVAAFSVLVFVIVFTGPTHPATQCTASSPACDLLPATLLSLPFPPLLHRKLHLTCVPFPRLAERAGKEFESMN
ncbi:hypothetical protein E2C01_079456 [Portunus trituberculatus]|uniref:Uncharacterized protein n=1 Tax=Portunus trituberculatus TaxID=210409 RepID=A0A5B7IRG7_PORTR|nr:hypothetical protein [Portunus trituberculatus]